jgi:uncharacterized protein
MWVRFRLFRNPSNVVIEGNCRQCGTCCRNLLLVDGEKIIRSEEQFETLKARHPELYRYFRVKSRNASGDLIFQCSQLTGDNRCALYGSRERPFFCASYPSRAMFEREGGLFKGCGYNTRPAIPFEEILGTCHSMHDD